MFLKNKDMIEALQNSSYMETQTEKSKKRKMGGKYSK